MKRLGIFFLNNQVDSVEDYVQYLLDDISLNLTHLCIIIDKKFNDVNVLKNYTEDIYINDNHNLNIWKEILVNHIGFNKLVDFDEIILFDNSFFGPLNSFKEIFNNIDVDTTIDLWTIFSNGLDDELNLGNLQFIAFRKKLIKSDDFKEFWMNVDENSLKNMNYENYLINHFSNVGFKWKNYLEYINHDLDEKEPFFSVIGISNLIINYKMPLINIKPFILPKKTHLDYHNGLDLSLTMDYLNEKSDYDVSLIYRYLLKIVDPNALVNNLNLKKSFPLENYNRGYKSEKAIVVIAHLYYDDLLDYDFKFLSNIPDYIDIIITTDDKDKKSLIEKNFLVKLKNKSQVILVNSRGRDMSGLFVGCKNIINNYDYFCFIHDKKSSHNTYSITGNSFRDTLWENMLASEEYINSIIKSFDENECLGLFVPPRIYHSANFTSFYYNFWLSNVDEINKLFDEMNINMELNLNELPLSIGNCFWAKLEALKPLFDLNLNYEDFPPEPLPLDGTIGHALERIYGHVAASQGFYTEISMTEDYGSNELTNYPYMFSELLMVIRNKSNKQLPSKYVSFKKFSNGVKDCLNDSDERIIELDKEINEIKNSNSWKITKPLRMFVFKLKSFKMKLIK